MNQTNLKNNKHHINQNVLKMYDIRGTINEDLFVDDAYYIGKAVATVLYRKYGAGTKRVVIGFDGRNSSPAILNKLKQGLYESGVDIINVGMCTSPMLAFANLELGVDASIMITASHNPASDNGFKIALKNNEPLFDENIKALATIMERADFYHFKEHGSISDISIQDEYIKRILHNTDNFKPLKVVWDCANGASCLIIKDVISKLPGDHLVLFDNIDGNFPNHDPDPSVSKNLVALQKAVQEHRADVGVAFDGDADRMTAVDNKGRIIENDRLLVIFAKDVISRNPDATVIMEVKSSNIAMEEIKKFGGNPVMYKTGHSCIKNKMKEIDALLAGETSGHFYWKEKFYGFDDGVYSAIRLLDIISRSGRSLGSINDEVPHGFTIEEVKIKVKPEEKTSIMEKLSEILKSENADILDIDGIRVNRKNGWWLIRPSQTSNAITIKCEGNDEISKEKMVNEIEKYLSNATNGNISFFDHLNHD